MKRDLGRLSNQTFDVVVIGGGIYGACAVWDATLRGLRVALVEKGDFGEATSANTQKIVHGGLRYLQHGDIKRMRESIRERRILMRIAPHLIRPLPFLMPTYRGTLRGRSVMAAAMAITDAIGWDRNQDIEDPTHQLPAGRVLSKVDCLRLAPGIREDGLTGGAFWWEAQMHNPERLTLSFLRSAAEAGAAVANYVRVTGFLVDGRRITGVKADDKLEGRRLEIRGRVVLNAAGPWVEDMLGLLNGRPPGRPLLFAKAMNVVTRPLTRNVGLGVASRAPSRTGSRLFFITPWRDRSVVGTAFRVHEGSPDACQVGEGEVRELINDINTVFPAAHLSLADVFEVQMGLVPVSNARADRNIGAADRHYQLWDHQTRDGVEGLVSMVGVKYTTARDVAEKAVNRVFAKLGRKAPYPLSRVQPLIGGHVGRFSALVQQVIRERPFGLSDVALRHLVSNHGAAYSDVLSWASEDARLAEMVHGSSEVLAAEVVHAVRQGMAVRLSDVMLRRTTLAAVAPLTKECLWDCARLMAKELGWDQARIEQEVDEVRSQLRRKSVRQGASVSTATQGIPV